MQCRWRLSLPPPFQQICIFGGGSSLRFTMPRKESWFCRCGTEMDCWRLPTKAIQLGRLEWGQIGGNTSFAPAGSEVGDIKRLNSLRNEFIHFTPKGWSLEVDGLPRIALAAARLISFLALETNNVFWHTAEARERLLNAHESFTKSMRELQALYAKSAG